MKKISKSLLIPLGLALALGLSACTGCSSHTWISSSESEVSSVSESSSSSLSSESKVNKYKIKWFNYDNSVLYTSRYVEEGTTPIYNGDTPTRPADEQFFYTWTGWEPEVVPAYEDTSYTATYSTELRTYTVSFPMITPGKGGKYSIDKIENVPYGTVVHVDGLSVEINGIVVTVEPDADEDVLKAFTYTFEGWNVEDGYVITGDTRISTSWDIQIRLYNLTIKAVGGGTLSCLVDGEYVQQDEFFFENAKAFGGNTTNGQEGTIISSNILDLYCDCPNFTHRFSLEAIECPDDTHDCAFSGWYYNDEPLHYFDKLYGDVVIEARFETVEKDYEIDSIPMEAIIVGVDRNVYHSESIPTLVLPRTYNGYIVAGMKGQVLEDIYGYESN